MRRPTLIFHRQVLRLCKGIIKAWEQWVEETEQEKPEILAWEENTLRQQKKYGEQEQYEKIMKL